MAGLRAVSNADNSVTIICSGEDGVETTFTAGPLAIASMVSDLLMASREAQALSGMPATPLGTALSGTPTAQASKIGVSKSDRDGEIVLHLSCGSSQIGFRIPTGIARQLAKGILAHVGRT